MHTRQQSGLMENEEKSLSKKRGQGLEIRLAYAALPGKGGSVKLK